MSQNEDKLAEKILTIIGVVCLIGILVPSLIILNGFFISLYWGWFVSKPFGLRPLTIPEAAGLGLLVYWMTNPSTELDTKTNWKKSAIRLFSRYIVTWLTAYIIHLFI